MYNHAPENYDCPFCKVAKRQDLTTIYTKEDDVFYRDTDMTAFVCSHSLPKDHGHILIIPNQHYENIYEIPDELLTKITLLAKRIAIGMKSTYQCAGVLLKEDNEPAGYQGIWHFHQHVIPKFAIQEDELETDDTMELVPENERKTYADKLRAYFEQEKV